MKIVYFIIMIAGILFLVLLLMPKRKKGFFEWCDQNRLVEIADGTWIYEYDLKMASRQLFTTARVFEMYQDYKRR